jgi:L-alanine-DL-glutamate epimerase-like enolase superfamily enzyme
MCAIHIAPDRNGEIIVPDAPGLGIEVDLAAMKRYLVDAEIRVKDRILYRTPRVD